MESGLCRKKFQSCYAAVLMASTIIVAMISIIIHMISQLIGIIALLLVLKDSLDKLNSRGLIVLRVLAELLATYLEALSIGYANLEFQLFQHYACKISAPIIPTSMPTYSPRP